MNHTSRTIKTTYILATIIALTALMALSVFAYTKVEASSANDLDLDLKVVYDETSAHNTSSNDLDNPVGEAKPDLPAPPTLPAEVAAAGSPQTAGGTFNFYLSCDAPSSSCMTSMPEVEWDFGDGITRIEQSLEVAHTYSEPGIYTVRAVAKRGTWFGEVTRTVFVAPHWADIATVKTYDGIILSEDAPAAYWRQDQIFNTDLMADSSIYGRDGTYTISAPALQFTIAEAAIASDNDAAVILSGAGEHAQVPAPTLGITGNDQFSVESWIYVDAVPAQERGILSLTSATSAGAHTWSVTPTGQLKIARSGATFALVAIPLTTWVHVGVSYDGTLMSIFLNGVPVRNQSPGEDFTLNGGALIGSAAGMAAFDGMLDEVAVYDYPVARERYLKHAETGTQSTITEARDDRNAVRAVTALNLFEPCGIANPQEGYPDDVLGRSLFCPEPITPARLADPAALIMPPAATKNGITGETCTSWWSACELPKTYFDGPTLATTNVVDTAGLVTAGFLDGTGKLVYDSHNCGDGWKAERNAAGSWEIVVGTENGCLTRGEWYETLISAIDGAVDSNPALSGERLVAPDTTATCYDITSITDAGMSFAYRRAIALGLTTPTRRLDNGGSVQHDYCDLNVAIPKDEAYASLGRVLGISSGASCSSGLSDLYDQDLGLGGLRDEHPDCGLIYSTFDRQAPLVGDLSCAWGSGDACLNPDDTINRADGAVILAGIVVEDDRNPGALYLELSHNGPKPIGTNITIKATGHAPLTIYGDFTFQFPVVTGMERTGSCGVTTGTVVIPSILAGTERYATAYCEYRLIAEEPNPLTVTLTDALGDPSVSETISVTGTNEPPSQPLTTTMHTIVEGPGAEDTTTFSSYDPNGTEVFFFVARDASSPWIDKTGPVGAYQFAITADNPTAYWRLNETAGPSAADTSGNNNVATITGATGNVAGGLADPTNSAFDFDGNDKISDTSVSGISQTNGGVTTMEMWTKWDGGVNDIVFSFDSVSEPAWGIKLTDDGLLGFKKSNNAAIYGIYDTTLANQWLYIVAEFHNGDVTQNRLWINGVEREMALVRGTVLPSGYAGPEVHIGSMDGSSGLYNGVIDEVAIYPGALSADRMRAHYELGLGTMISGDISGKDMVQLELSKISNNSHEVIATALNQDVNGTYSFLMKACDADSCSSEITVTGTITPTADAPFAAAGGLIEDNGFEGGPAVYPALHGIDSRDAGWAGYTGAITTYRLTAGPSTGTLYYDSDNSAGTNWVVFSGTAVNFASPVLKYLPDVGPYGDGTFNFTYRVLDSGYPTTSWSPHRTVDIFVLNMNDPPICLNVASTTNEDTAKSINFNCSDADADPLTYTIVSNPAHGALSGTGASRTYTPSTNWCGADSYTYKAKDFEMFSGTQTVNVTVNCINDAPTKPTGAMPTRNEDVNSVATFTTTDVDNGPNWTFYVSNSASGSYSSSSKAITGGTVSVAQGSLTNKTASVTFNNSANWCGTYTFYIKAYDGSAWSSVSTESGVQTCINDVPTTPGAPGWTNMIEDLNPVTKTYTTSDPDSSYWCLQYKQWSTSTPSPTLGGSNNDCHTGVTVNQAITLSAGRGVVTVQQGSFTDKSATVKYDSAPNWVGTDLTFYTRFCDSNNACSGWRYDSPDVVHNTDDIMVATTDGGTRLKWWENNSMYSSWQRSWIWEYNDGRIPVIGDWNGDGIDDTGINHTNDKWYLDANHDLVTESAEVWKAGFRGANGVPFTGDWDGDGDDDYGMYTHDGYLHLFDRDDAIDIADYRAGAGFMTGKRLAGGDANNDGTDEVFMWDVDPDSWSTTGDWYIMRAQDTRSDLYTEFEYGYCDVTSFAIAGIECAAVVGDWDGNGTETIGVYYGNTGEFYARNSNSPGGSNYSHTFSTSYYGMFGYDNPN